MVAVGAVCCDSETIKMKKEKEGIAVYILTYKGDCLYKYGSNEDKKVIFDG